MGNYYSKRSLRGKKTNRTGKVYEKVFKTQCEAQGAFCLRIEDGARAIPVKLPMNVLPRIKNINVGQVVRKKQPFDFIVNHKSKVLLVDVKTTERSRLNYSYLHSTLTKPHQLTSLNGMRSACYTGLVVFHIEQNLCVFYDINVILNLKPRTSLTEKDGVVLGKANTFNLDLIFS